MKTLKSNYTCAIDSTETVLYMLKSYNNYSPFYVPDTLIYKAGLPDSWFFTEDKRINQINPIKDEDLNKIIKKCVSKNIHYSKVCGLFIKEESVSISNNSKIKQTIKSK